MICQHFKNLNLTEELFKNIFAAKRVPLAFWITLKYSENKTEKTGKLYDKPSAMMKRQKIMTIILISSRIL